MGATVRGKVGRQAQYAVCVGQQLHVVCGARLQTNVGPFAQGHASLGGEGTVPHPRPAFPSCADWLLGYLAADQCSSL